MAPDRFQTRFFLPTASGMTEDPGTGSACANLGGYLLDAGEPAPARFTVTQGEFINRLNVLQLSLTAERRVRWRPSVGAGGGRDQAAVAPTSGQIVIGRAVATRATTAGGRMARRHSACHDIYLDPDSGLVRPPEARANSPRCRRMSARSAGFDASVRRQSGGCWQRRV